MECPHCQQETDPTLLYCKVCGEQVELDPEAVHEALRRDEERDAIEIMAQQARIAIYVASFFFVCVFAFRLVVQSRPVSWDVSPGYFAPARILEEKNLDPPAQLDTDPAPIPIVPDEKTRKDYLEARKAH